MKRFDLRPQPWIQNVSLAAISSGMHFETSDQDFLIQIVDPCTVFPTPKQPFGKVFQFIFLDTEVGVIMGFVDPECLRIPNSLVKKKLLNHLNLGFSPKNSAFTVGNNI